MAENADKVGAEAHMLDAQEQGLPGSFLRPIKVTLLGAGSVFTPRLVGDLTLMPGADRVEIALVDVDEPRLATMRTILQRLLTQRGKSGWTVTASTDRREVLAGSDYLVSCVEVAGVECVAIDNDIPLEYGIDQCIGDTIGPGGLFKAMRTVPVFLEILRDAEELCPQALMLNYTNPMNILCLASGRASRLPLVGLCHSVQGTARKLAEWAGVPIEEMGYACAGINHLAWFTRVEHRGRDLYPQILERTSEPEVFEDDKVRIDMMRHFGAFITESSGHLSEYLPYYRTNPERVKAYAGAGYRGESRFYATYWPQWRARADRERQEMLDGTREIAASDRSHEYASWIIEAREKDRPIRIHGNVMNTDNGGDGRLITNLPGDGCVEVACLVDRDGVRPTRYGALPPQMAHVCGWNMAVFDLAATACIEKSKEAAVHALLLDPLTSSILPPAKIKEMALRMFEAENAFLPGWR